ncbi:MAG TPA: hypothetical protein VHM72_03770 [Solirubrobacteraceae bacterium]|nr:hypothetical protein [Solirubrobacteraceae bacterium]
MRHRILRAPVALAVAGAVAGGGAAYAAGTLHHARRVQTPRYDPASGAAGTHHCSGT